MTTPPRKPYRPPRIVTEDLRVGRLLAPVDDLTLALVLAAIFAILSLLGDLLR